MHSKIVRLHCRLSLLVACRSGIWLENLQTLITRAQGIVYRYSLCKVVPTHPPCCAAVSAVTVNRPRPFQYPVRK